MYNHSNQYRCTIIRGKSQSEIDNMLPAYASVLDDICPCKLEAFPKRFNEKFSIYLSSDKRTKKTLDNHRTEIAGKLFGMYFEKDDYIYLSERTLKYLNDSDQPAFFKDICYKFQFPNGTQKINTVKKRVDDGINIKPNAFVLKTLVYARNAGVEMTKKDIGYYVLNSLDVLQGKANPLEVIDVVVQDKKLGISRVINTPGKASSYDYQHINEQLNYLELANLIRIENNGVVVLNEHEEKTIDLFIDSLDTPLFFSFDKYNLEESSEVRQMQKDWDIYYSELSNMASKFETSLESLGIVPTTSDDLPLTEAGESTVALGDEGENYVFNYERERVSKVNKRLVNKVLLLGRTKGIGYDIQSVIGEPGERMEFVKYIEVKSTRRVTAPDLSDAEWCDTVNITRNEWVAAQQHKEFYSIYRVYFVRNNVFIHVIENVSQKHQQGKILVTPMSYRVDYDAASIDRVLGGEINV